MALNQSQMGLLPGLFIAFLTVLFGANVVAIKLTLTGMGPMTIAGCRFALAAVAIACWARITGRRFRIQPGQAFQLLVIAVAFTLQLSLFYLGLKRTEASRGVLISNLLPFFVLFLSHRFIPGEQITWKKFVGILLGFAGVTVLFSGAQSFPESIRAGDPIVLAAVVIWSCNVVYTKSIINAYEPFHLVLYPMIVSVPVFLSAGCLWDQRMVFDLNPVVLRRLCVSGPGYCGLRFCGLEHHAETIRGVHPARLCFYHAHCRGGAQRHRARRAHHAQSPGRHDFHCRRHFNRSYQPEKAEFYLSTGPRVVRCS